MNLIKKIFLLLFFVLPTVVWAHPFYVSLCQVDYNSSNHSLEISVKIFADDLLKALENKGIADLHLGEENENPKSGQYIFDYLKENLKFKVDETPVSYRFIGKEMEDDAVWCYLEINQVSSLKKIEVTNRILTEVFDTQSNVVQVNKNKKILNLLLSAEKPSGSLSFD